MGSTQCAWVRHNRVMDNEAQGTSARTDHSRLRRCTATSALCALSLAAAFSALKSQFIPFSLINLLSRFSAIDRSVRTHDAHAPERAPGRVS